ncbi:MAG: endonuclease/exonuclease/phosphatase family protein [Gammaproteobacteria bacterium]
MITKRYQKTQRTLEDRLSNSAFRHGTSAFRLGLIPESYSDHLPFEAKLSLEENETISLISWNLLSDDHLYNNFMNISGTELLNQAIAEHFGSENIYSPNCMHHFFSELAQYLFSKQQDGKITLNHFLLNTFISTSEQPSRLARSRNLENASLKQQQVERSRKEIIEIMTNENHPHAHEFKLAIRHSLELIYHIQDQSGSLKWENRLARLKENRALISQLVSTDVLSLQEVTNPTEIQTLFDEAGKDIHMLSHKVNESSNDYAVLLFDPNKFHLIDWTPISIEGKKPGIFAKLESIATNEAMIFSSIHHPGGEHNYLNEILSLIETLREPHEETIFFIAGDFNHTEDFFQDESKSEVDYRMVYPTQATMAGSDYGNTNKAIDALLTNLPTGNIEMRRIGNLPVSAPSKTPVVVNFESNENQRVHDGLRFFHSTETSISMGSLINETIDLSINTLLATY